MTKIALTHTVNHITINALHFSDISRCVDIEKELFSLEEPWEASAFVYELRSSYTTYLAARDNELLVGYAGVRILPASNNEPALAEIHNIAVSQSYQGKGIGRLLMCELIKLADQQQAQTFLEVRIDNQVAKKLYESLGFSVIGIRKKYYRPAGIDAYSMRREVQ